MDRLADVEAFYQLMDKLERSVGAKRTFSDANGGMSWPSRGVYFIYEPGEFRSGNGQKPRVVRVGTHALTAKSRTTIWQRLRQHRGTLKPTGGNHRGSIFRLLVGNAMIGQGLPIAVESWGHKANAPKHIKIAERPVEEMVSQYIGEMTIIFLPIEDPSGPDSRRGYVERNAIALLSNYSNEAIDPPSTTWLGSYCDREKVRNSGLWNNNHVDEPYDPGFLRVLEDLVGVTKDP